MPFRRALDRGNVTEALSSAAELQFVGLTEALELTVLLADGELAKYERAALRWHVRFVYESKNVDSDEPARDASPNSALSKRGCWAVGPR